jgi:hypothetical protein
MNREFQALCQERMPSDCRIPSGVPFTVRHICAGADEFEAMLLAAGVAVVPGSITEIRAVVDWAKPVFDRDEAAAYIGNKAGTLSQIKGSGEIPFSQVNGRTVYPRRLLEKLLDNNANPAGKTIVKQLEQTAA